MVESRRRILQGSSVPAFDRCRDLQDPTTVGSRSSKGSRSDKQHRRKLKRGVVGPEPHTNPRLPARSGTAARHVNYQAKSSERLRMGLSPHNNATRLCALGARGSGTSVQACLQETHFSIETAASPAAEGDRRRQNKLLNASQQIRQHPQG